ncbi:MAG: methyltransferase domain-containing protein [Paludibaculum sp.]
MGITDTVEWNASLYSQRHSFVWKSAEDLIALLNPAPGEHILDVGCGTGQLTAKLGESGAVITGLDSSETMLEQARVAYPAGSWIHASLPDFVAHEQFDAIFSNAALHWIRPPQKAAERMFAALKPGGRLIAEFGGAGNTASILKAAREIFGERGETVEVPWYFPGIGEYSTVLENAGFEVVYALLFDRMTPLDGGQAGLANWLEMFAPQWRASVLNRFEEKVRPTLYDEQSGQWRMDYRRLRIAARKRA